ncbi:MAG: (d)CMP kinase [Flavobacteriaceae bacterium]
MNSQTQVIAIDGYASTGKSTLAKKLAQHLGYLYMDTGWMFRALTYEALQRGLLTEDGLDTKEFESFVENCHFQWQGKELNLNNQAYGDELRSHDVTQQVSFIAALPAVRSCTLKSQQDLAKDKKIIMDGRDIGTVVFPHASVKFFLTAATEVRAQRRWTELQQKGEKVSLDEVHQNVLNRDKRDSNRSVAPLRQASDAVVIDTSNLTLDEVFEKMISHIH